MLFKYFSFYDIKYHQIKYENISDFKRITKLIKFLNLNFEDNIYNYQKPRNREKKQFQAMISCSTSISSSINSIKTLMRLKKLKLY